MQFYEPKDDADGEPKTPASSAASVPEPPEEAEDAFGAYVIKNPGESTVADTSARPQAPEDPSTSEEVLPPKRRKFSLREFKPLPYLFPLIMSGGTFAILVLMEESESESKSVNQSGIALRNAPPPKLDFIGDQKPLELDDVKRLFAFQQTPTPPRDAPSAPLDMARTQPLLPSLPMSPMVPPTPPPLISGQANSTPSVVGRPGTRKSPQRSAGVAAAPQSPRRPIYARPGGTIKVLPESNEAQLLEVGQRFKATLNVGVSSSSHSRKVLARVKSDVQNGHRVALKAGDMLEGSASYDHTRVYLTFNQVKTRGRKRVIAGEAISENLIGLDAGVQRDGNNQPRVNTLKSTVKAMQNAMQVGINAVASGTLPGRLAGGVASDVARDTAAQVEREHMAPASPVPLQLLAGTEFEIVITGD